MFRACLRGPEAKTKNKIKERISDNSASAKSPHSKMIKVGKKDSKELDVTVFGPKTLKAYQSDRPIS